MARRGVVVVGLLAQHGVGRHQHLHAVWRIRSAAGDLETFRVPGLQGLGAGRDGVEYPSSRRRTLIADFHHGVDHADLLRLGHLDALAFHEQGRGGHHADQARHALRAASTGQQAQRDFGEAEARLGIVGRDTVMTAECDFHAATQCAAVERRRNRLAAEFDGAHELVRLADRSMKGCRIGGGTEFGEVTAGDEILFCRSNHNALDRRIGQRLLHGFAVGTQGLGIEDVLRLVRVIEFDRSNAVCVYGVIQHVRLAQ